MVTLKHWLAYSIENYNGVTRYNVDVNVSAYDLATTYGSIWFLLMFCMFACLLDCSIAGLPVFSAGFKRVFLDCLLACTSYSHVSWVVLQALI